jgi:DNA-directed RNA polymerase subunit RPC12/RpoP
MERGILCKKCGHRYPTTEMTYLHDAKNMMCTGCLNKLKDQINASSKALAADDKSIKGKERYKCLRCKHVFMLKEGFNKICPYCASPNLGKQDWNSDLDNLIAEAGQKIYDN